jgi:hypothetical protein
MSRATVETDDMADIIAGLLKRVKRLEGESVPILPNTPWVNLVLSNGWVPYGAGWATPGYRRLSGIVFFRGLMKLGVGVGVFSSVPVGFRPSTTRLTWCPVDTYGGVVPRIDVLSDGTITFVQGASGYVSLDMIVYPAEA